MRIMFWCCGCIGTGNCRGFRMSHCIVLRSLYATFLECVDTSTAYHTRSYRTSFGLSSSRSLPLSRPPALLIPSVPLPRCHCHPKPEHTRLSVLTPVLNLALGHVPGPAAKPLPVAPVRHPPTLKEI
ncbi:hypothetical protein P152DRAFT_138966 [Eremomyces bilateralis CBS 781.70]|uniref:Secreted protein n=1 Tax=Eremomyces bilateralis CBS 781.70 TaxID=1392243 RepID=A0A6G1FW56_9PEZI|nr:uncharacterized protein P152DRAFT_138966 [Eremomyces bilateralis CBS 781.70]KAF1810067.1 hypothetical protein P152DRAFT_138966 [Eremomyces bilateralis CBS 781.70]